MLPYPTIYILNQDDGSSVTQQREQSSIHVVLPMRIFLIDSFAV